MASKTQDSSCMLCTAQQARENWATILNNAQFLNKPTKITRHGVFAAVVVNPDWYEQARTALDTLAKLQKQAPPV